MFSFPLIFALCYFFSSVDAFYHLARVRSIVFPSNRPHGEFCTRRSDGLRVDDSLSPIDKDEKENVLETQNVSSDAVREAVIARALMDANKIVNESEGAVSEALVAGDTVVEPIAVASPESESSLTTLSAEELSASLKEKSSVELAEFAGEAFRKTTLGLIAATSGIIDGSISFLSSSEAEESRMSLDLSSNAASLAGKSLLKGLSAVADEWNSVMNVSTNAGSPDVELLLQAINKVVNSTEVKDSIFMFGDNVVKSTQEVGTAGSLVASGLSKQLSLSPKWNDALREVVEGLVMLYLVISVAGAKAINPDKQLPDGRK